MFEFFDCHLLYSVEYVQNIHHRIEKTKQNKKI